MSAFFEKLLDLLFPPRCPFCRALLRDNEELLCRRCRQTLPWTPEAAQKQSFRHVEACVSPLYYEGDVRRSLLRYKFGGLSVYAPKYAELMCACIERNGLSFDLISWAPLGPKRLRKRGYDQAKLLAQEISKRFGVPCAQLLEKTADFRFCLTQCLWMALFFALDRIFHAFSTSMSHQATFEVLANVRRRLTLHQLLLIVSPS